MGKKRKIEWEALDFSSAPNAGLQQFGVSIDGGKIYVSDKSDYRYQMYSALHETFCPLTSKELLPGLNTCCKVEQAIIKEVVPVEYRLQFITDRMKMFRGLIAVFGPDNSNFSSFNDTLSMLEIAEKNAKINKDKFFGSFRLKRLNSNFWDYEAVVETIELSFDDPNDESLDTPDIEFGRKVFGLSRETGLPSYATLTSIGKHGDLVVSFQDKEIFVYDELTLASALSDVFFAGEFEPDQSNEEIWPDDEQDWSEKDQKMVSKEKQRIAKNAEYYVWHKR